MSEPELNMLQRQAQYSSNQNHPHSSLIFLRPRFSGGRHSLVGALIWILPAFALPAVGGTIRPIELFLGTLIFLGGWALGVLLLHSVNTVNEMSALTREGVAILVGFFIFYPVCALPISEHNVQIAFACISAVMIGSTFWMGAATVKLPKGSELLALSVACALAILLSVGNGDLTRGLNRLPVTLTESLVAGIFDGEYLTSVIATMRHGTIASAIFEKGSPLAYQVLGAFPPATFAAASGAPSQVALWGIWMPFLKILGLLLIGEVATRFMPPQYEGKVWISALVIALFVFLQPLHPIYVLKGIPRNFVWPGIGWLWGGLELSTVAGIVWAGMALATAFPATPSQPTSRSDLVFAAAVIATLLSVKVPIFFALGIFLTAIGVMRARNKDYAILYRLVIATPFAIGFYSWVFRGSTVTPSFKFGYLPYYFASLFGVNGESALALLVGISGGFALYLLWGGIRWLGLIFLSQSLDPATLRSRGREAAIGTIAALMSCSALAAVLTITMRRGISLSTIGETTDQSFNLLQFPRASFLLVSIFGVAGVMGWVLTRRPGFSRKCSVGIIGIWCVLAGVSLVSMNMRAPSTIDNSWLTQVLLELKGSPPPRLAAIDPSLSYPGLLLTSADVGPFWVSQNHVNKTQAISFRWKVFDDALSGNTALQASACETMSREGVDALIATVDSQSRLEGFARTCGFERAPTTRWVWRRVMPPRQEL